MAIDMSQFYQVFFEEAAEHLASMEALLLAIDPGAPDPEEVNALFRAAHSIKGSSGTFGFQDMMEVTHILETMLDRVRKGEAPLTDDMVDASLVAGDVLKNLLAAHRGEEDADGPRPRPSAIALRPCAARSTRYPPRHACRIESRAPPLCLRLRLLPYLGVALICILSFLASLSVIWPVWRTCTPSCAVSAPWRPW
jgi:two-component system chemotaxis sensor kinase CheA